MHRAAAVGFDRAAGAYERGRAGYPVAAVETILAATDAAPGRTLLELGAGTGKLTRELVGSGARVIALGGRRDARMLAGLHRRRAAGLRCGGARSRMRASTRSSPRKPSLVRSRVAAGGVAPALARGRRPDLESARRARGVGAELSRILDGLAGDAPRYRTGLWRRGFDGNPAFEPLALETWPHRGAEGREVVLDRVASMSFVASLGEQPRAQLLAEVTDLLETHPDLRGREDVALPYVTELFTTRRAELPDGSPARPPER